MWRLPPNWRQLLLRRKAIDTSPSTLPRKLTTWDLIGLGMGATLGAGAYVLVGVVAKNKSGPAIILSFLVSGIASILSALCYAEFGARVPRAGSAYVYSYVTVGEVLAWTTGWQLLLEYIIGASSVARAWSGYVDFLANGAISSYLNSTIGNWTVPQLASYPDFLAVGMTLFLSIVCSIGVRESTIVNNILTGINVMVILFVCIAGSFYVHTENYANFAPFGVKGVFDGAATAFFAYVGFDVIATSAEEVVNPSKAIPIGIIVSLVLCMICYMGVSAVVTLMVNYAAIDATAPLASAFSVNNVGWAKYIISIGAICGLSTSLMTSIFPMPRIVYAIASDGLLPEWLGAVHPYFNTPLRATMICGALSAALALIFDLNALADMMSIGTLLSYTLVAASVLVLRYRQYDESLAAPAASASASGSHEGAALLPADGVAPASAAGSSGTSSSSPHSEPLLDEATSDSLSVVPPPRGLASLIPRTRPSGGIHMWGGAWSSYAAASAQLSLYALGSIFLSVALVVLQTYDLSPGGTGALYAFAGLGGVMIVYTGAALIALPRTFPVGVAFVAPFVPVLPLLSVLVNVYLLVCLSPFTWVRFAVWCIIGTAIYVFYGLTHSKAKVEGADGAASGARGGQDASEMGVEVAAAASGVAGTKGAYMRVAVADQ